MNKVIYRQAIHAGKKRPPLPFGCPSLSDDGLTQWMMAANKKLVSLRKALKIRYLRHADKLSPDATVAFGTCQNKVPNPIHIHSGNRG